MHEHPPFQIMPHLHPVWSERSDHEIDLRIPDVDDALERLTVRQVSEHEFEVCCVPYALYGFALGDTIHVDGLTNESPGNVTDVTRRVGRHAYRVALYEATEENMQSLASSLASMGFLLEVWSPMMVAVDASDDHSGQVLRAFLEDGFQEERWQYEVVHQPE